MSQTQWYIHEEEENKKVLVSDKSYSSNNDSLVSIKEQRNIDNLLEKVKRYKTLTQQCLSQKNDNVNRYLKETEGMNDLNKAGRLKSKFEHTNWKLDVQLQTYSNKISKYSMLLRLKEKQMERKQSLSPSGDINNNNLSYTNNNNNNINNSNNNNMPNIKTKNTNMSTIKRHMLPRLIFSSYGSADDISKHKECHEQHQQPSHHHHHKEGPMRLFKASRRISLFHGKKCKSAFDLTPEDQKFTFHFDIKQEQNKKQKSNKKTKKLNNTSVFHITTDMYNNDDNDHVSLTSLKEELAMVEELSCRMEEDRWKNEHLKMTLTDCELQFERMLKDTKLLSDQPANKCVVEERLVDVLTEQIQEINSLKNDLVGLEDEIQEKADENNKTVLKALELCHQTLLKIEQTNLHDQPMRADLKLSQVFIHSTNQALEMLASIFVLLASSISSSCAFIYHHHCVSLLSLAAAVVASIAWWY